VLAQRAYNLLMSDETQSPATASGRGRRIIIPSPQMGPLGRPVGRRIFLGLLAAGVAGMGATKWLYRADDADSNSVASAVRLGSMTPDDQEALIGQHPNHNYTERFRYYSVGDIPNFNSRSWRLAVDGEGVNSNLSLRFDDVKAFPQYAVTADFRCVNGWIVHNCIWIGVRVRDVVDAVSPNDRAKFVTFYSGDGVYTDSLTWAQARSDHAILAWQLNGDPLIREQGYPLRLIYPDMYGYKNVKWLRRIEVKSARDLGFWEQTGWEIDAYVYTPPS
jgi:DMSO/TMAO reductase YedYZ molybdopterin-dependent catalytic subunit